VQHGGGLHMPIELSRYLLVKALGATRIIHIKSTKLFSNATGGKITTITWPKHAVLKLCKNTIKK
jgi:hypothetical protein